MLEVEGRVSGRAEELFRQQQDRIYIDTDRLFAPLLFLQWLGTIAMAWIVSPYTWSGQTSALHIHVWAAIFLGGTISLFPIWLTRAWPGAAITRHVIAVAQMLMSALLISITGGRIETHFHVFGSLVILSFYRDWRVLIPATVVVGLDHFLRGVYWPYSVYGVLSASPWRSIEHAAWVGFEDVFLVISCLRSIQEMRSIANRTAELEAGGEVHHAILNSALDCIITIDEHGRVQEFNPAAERTFGYTRAEAMSREMAELIVPQRLREQHRRGMAHFLKTGEGPVIGKRIEVPALRRDGGELLVELAVTSFKVDGAPLFTAYLRDITERVRNDRRRVAQYRVANLLNESWTPEEAAPEILQNVASIGDWVLCQLWLLDEAGTTLRLHSSWSRDGEDLREFVGSSRSKQFKISEGLPGRIWESRKPVWIRDVAIDANFPRGQWAKEADLHGGFGFPLFAGSDLIGIIEAFSHQPGQADDDLLELVAAFGTEIGLFIHRRAAEEILREKTKQLEAAVQANQLIMDNSQDVICTADNEGRFVSMNVACQQLWGYEPDELIGRKYMELVYPGDHAKTAQAAAELKETGRIGNFTNRCIRKDGSLVDVLWSASWSAADQITFAIAHDITERKRAEEALLKAREQEALRKVEEKYRVIFENAVVGIFQTTPDGRYLSVNPALARICGYDSPEELVASVTDVAADIYVDPARRDEFKRLIETQGFVELFEYEVHRKDRSKIWLLENARAVRDETGAILYYEGTAEDITYRKRVEEVERANKAKSEFLSRVSHELRTPLNAILGFGQLLERQNPTDTQRARVRHIVSAGKHLLGLINEVLDISRIESGRLQLSLEPVGVTNALSEALDLMRPLAAERQIQLSTPATLDQSLFVQADRQRLKQVLLNLLTNAVKYTPLSGSVAISHTAGGDGHVRIFVRDTGPGIPREKLDRLFMPFERLGAEQSNVEGTGLGLALSQRLMQAMRGSIVVESTVGEGSTFWLELPRAKSPLPSPVSQENAGSGRHGHSIGPSRKILYIEDNPSNLTLIEQLLEERPEIKLITAMQGSVGVDLARRHSPDVILLDVHLPDIDGREVISQLKAEAATRQIPVVVISADATARQIQRLMKAGANAYLTKPINVTEFLQAVEKAIQQSAAIDQRALPDPILQMPRMEPALSHPDPAK